MIQPDDSDNIPDNVESFTSTHYVCSPSYYLFIIFLYLIDEYYKKEF